LNDKEIALIIHNSSGNFQSDFVKAVWNISVPGGFSLKVLPAEGADKFSAYNSAMKNSDAKYKIYLDENAVIANKNFLYDVIKIFESDEKIGVIGTSGAVELSTHGICLSSAKRCGKILRGLKTI